MSLTIKEIKKRIGKPLNEENDYDINSMYKGIDMNVVDTTGNIEEGRIKNFEFIKKIIPEYLEDFVLGDYWQLWAWKGSVWWGSSDMKKIFVDFSGDSTEDIIYKLILYQPWIMEAFERLEKKITSTDLEIEEYGVARIISKQDRYEILKRQKWRCNCCACVLKYSKESQWQGEVAHIDHIHPFSKRETYPNGRYNINESSNLQALCPKCNLSKKDKPIQ